MIRIAVPSEGGSVSSHFGHAEQFAFFDVDPEAKQITNSEMIDAPPHQPGLLPVWLHEHKANVILSGGMGGRARQLLEANNIKVVTGVGVVSLDRAVQDYINGSLTTTENSCDHSGSCG